jgi:hypothetical protein
MSLAPKDVLKNYLHGAPETLIWKADGLSERDQRLTPSEFGFNSGYIGEPSAGFNAGAVMAICAAAAFVIVFSVVESQRRLVSTGSGVADPLSTSSALI